MIIIDPDRPVLFSLALKNSLFPKFYTVPLFREIYGKADQIQMGMVVINCRAYIGSFGYFERKAKIQTTCANQSNSGLMLKL